MHLTSLVVLVDSLGLLDPDAVTELASSAKLELMLFLHFSWSHEAALVPVIRWKVPKDLKNRVANTIARVINVLSANMLRSKLGALELILTRFCKEGTVFAVQLVRDNSDKNFIFQKNSILVFLKGNVKFKRAVMSTPRMITFITPEFKKAFLDPLNN